MVLDKNQKKKKKLFSKNKLELFPQKIPRKHIKKHIIENIFYPIFTIYPPLTYAKIRKIQSVDLL